MKITGVKTTEYPCRSPRSIEDAGSCGVEPKDTNCLVELHTDVGLTGIGISRWLNREHVQTLVDTILLGRDPRGVTGLWQSMLESTSSEASGSLIQAAIAVLDIALWDIKAKADGEPLWKTLGGNPPKANAYVSDNALQLPDGELFNWYNSIAGEFGFREGKLKVGLNQESDMHRLGLMREALLRDTAEPVLMIDAEQCWSAKQAIRNVREMEKEYDLTWVEAPTQRWDFPGLKRISDNVRAAVCCSESLSSPGEFLPHFQHHSFDVIQLSTARIGITGALQLADAAYGFELPVTLANSPGNIHAHLAGAMPYFMSMEVTEPVPCGSIFTTDVRIVDGWAVVGDKAGHGLEIDAETLAKAAEELEG